MTRKAALTGAAILLLLLVLAGALCAKPPPLTLPLPDAGHVSVAAVSMKVKADRPRGLVRHVRVRALRVKSLPPSVRVLTATRFKRSKHGGTYSAFVQRRGSRVACSIRRTSFSRSVRSVLA